MTAGNEVSASDIVLDGKSSAEIATVMNHVRQQRQQTTAWQVAYCNAVANEYIAASAKAAAAGDTAKAASYAGQDKSEIHLLDGQGGNIGEKQWRNR